MDQITLRIAQELNKPAQLVQNVITYIIPFALTAYYPALFILRGENPLFNLGMPVLASAVLMTAP